MFDFIKGKNGGPIGTSLELSCAVLRCRNYDFTIFVSKIKFTINDGDMMKIIKVFIVAVLVIFIYVIFVSFIDWREEVKNIEDSNVLITKIEDFKNREGHLPASLEEIGLITKEHGLFYNIMHDPKSYCVSFVSSNDAFNNVVYCSDVKRWDEFCGSWLFGNRHCHYP